VQELHTSQKFAVIKKDVNLARGDKDGMIPLGTLTVTNKTVQVDPGGGKPAETVAVGDLGNVVDEASFHKAFAHPNILHDWSGEATVGVSLVEATQSSTSFNTSISLLRATPSEAWLAPRNRTLLDFSDSYGKVTQPGTPEVKTSIFHAGAERDEYFSSRVYALGAVAFDHNFSQGLDLQQQYGGGFGWSVIRGAKETLDLKGSVDYERQEFQVATQNQNLINSVFSELYGLKFSKGIVLSQLLSVSPAWNNTNAYSANASVGVTFPVYKGFGFTANVIDSYLNDPPTGFKKNSVQFSTGLSYSIP
jgi:putative salt-induced outer membrane protein YdiY